VALAPQMVALPVEILPRRLPLLLPQPLLLLPDPAQLGDGEEAKRVETHPYRSGHAHPSRRRMNAQMDVLDVLEHHVHRDLTQVQLGAHQYSPCALTMWKMRSTSPTSRRTSYSARLMTSSRAWTPRHPSGRAFFTVSSMRNASANARSAAAAPKSP